MKTSFNILLTLVVLLFSTNLYAQQPELDNFRDPGKKGLNVFETPKGELGTFDGLKVRVGGDFALQIQGITQENTDKSFVKLENNLNLPSANLNIDVQLHRGVRMHLRTYLSSRHHNEAWVKGGYMQIDALDFIKEGFLDNVMQFVTFRAGMDEINYGDTHFKRTDNARAIYNPFVGNFIMDSFTTEPFLDATFQYKGILGVVGVSNGKLNQSTIAASTDDAYTLSYFAKLGYDKQLNEDLRVRATGSIYMNSGTSTGGYLFSGDRAGDRYYNVGITTAEAAGKKWPTYVIIHNDSLKTSDLATSDPVTFVSARANARFAPSFKEVTAMQFAGFVKWRGLESFSLFEIVSNASDAADARYAGGSYMQIGEELLYRLGSDEQFYVGGRYNMVSGKDKDGADTKTITRMNIGGGWFMTDNVVTKVEYVNQSWTGDGWTSKWVGAKFSGIMIEAVIGF